MSCASRTARLSARAALAICGVSLLSLTACQDEQSAFAPACPHVQILSEAADFYDYDGKGLDVGDLVARASMAGLSGSCTAGPNGPKHQKTVRTSLSIAVDVVRGPAKPDEKIVLPYFVAVMRDGHIVDKKVFEVAADFAPNTTTSHLRAPVRYIDLPASDSIQETNYSMAVGFQLNHSQLGYNRAHLPEASFLWHIN